MLRYLEFSLTLEYGDILFYVVDEKFSQGQTSDESIAEGSRKKKRKKGLAERRETYLRSTLKNCKQQ